MKKLVTFVVIALFTAGGVVLASAMSRSVMQDPTTVSMVGL